MLVSKRVLVTGHRGYIGTILVPKLLEAGHEVVGLDSDLFRQCSFTGKIPEVPTILKDVRDVEHSDLENFDAIIHLAGLSNDPLGDYKPGLTEEINSQATLRLAKLGKRMGVKRFLFASSCSNYGASDDAFLLEDAKLKPVTPYGRSKVTVETELASLADENFTPTFLRASTAYGVSPRLRFDLVVNNLTAWAFTTGMVYIKSDGTPWRPVVHVEDICLAYLAVLHAPREIIHNESFNVGLTSENYQVRDLAQIVKDIVPGCRIEYSPGGGPDKRCYRVDCNKIARTLPEFKPQWTARRGIEELYESYKTVGLTVEEFEGDRYQRIAHVKKLTAEGYLDETLRWKRPLEVGGKDEVPSLSGG